MPGQTGHPGLTRPGPDLRRGKTHLGLENVCLVREKAQEEPHEEGPGSAVGLSVVRDEVQRGRSLAKHTGEKTKVTSLLGVDMEKGVSQVPLRQSANPKETEGTFGRFLGNTPHTARDLTGLPWATAGSSKLQIPLGPSTWDPTEMRWLRSLSRAVSMALHTWVLGGTSWLVQHSIAWVTPRRGWICGSEAVLSGSIRGIEQPVLQGALPGIQTENPWAGQEWTSSRPPGCAHRVQQHDRRARCCPGQKAQGVVIPSFLHSTHKYMLSSSAPGSVLGSVKAALRRGRLQGACGK